MALPIRIRSISLPRQRNRNGLRLPVHGDIDHHGVTFQIFDEPVHHLVALAQNVAVAARVFDQGKLVESPQTMPTTFTPPMSGLAPSP
jgi:hypothetical protein